MHIMKWISTVPYLCVLFVSVCLHTVNVQAQCLVHAFTGEAAGDRFGVCVSGAGDVDADGYADLVVGAQLNQAGGLGAGRAYVYSGRTGGLLWTFTGEAAVDNFGISVSGAGDVDHDGYADLIVGAHGNDAGGTDAGRAYVFSGLTGAILWTFTGEAAGDFLGYSSSGAGDVDKDGYADLIVGAHANDANGNAAGRAYVYSGQTGALLWAFSGEAETDLFGGSVSGAGDVDNDGYADLIIGATGNDAGGGGAGRAYVYSGRTGDLLHTFTGEAAGAQMGESVSGAGDVDGDGYADVIVGDARGSGAGRAHVYSGRTGGPLWTFTGEAAGDNFGFSVSGAGDADHDGYADLIVGAPGNDAGGTNAGRAYVFSGLTGAILWTFTGAATDDHFAFCVSGGGDVTNDEYAEVIVGAFGNDAGGADAGRAYVYAIGDLDEDGIPNSCDNCPAAANTNQQNSDGDSHGDACDNCPTADNSDQADDDGDSVGDVCDNCMAVSNSDQTNADADSLGDACDNCPSVSNDDQANSDEDLIGDACDNCVMVTNQDQANSDADSLGDACDNCPSVTNDDQIDSDSDGIGDACDNCPSVTNQDQTDGDSDGIGDLCDNCPTGANATQTNSDADSLGDACDNCPGVANDDQSDFDGDGEGMPAILTTTMTNSLTN